MSKEKHKSFSNYFDEYTVDSWSYSSFIRYALNKRLLPSDPIKVYNYNYKKCLDKFEQKYDPLKCSKAISLKKTFKCPSATLGFLGMLQLLCSIQQSINTKQGVHAPLWLDKKMEKEWLTNLDSLAKNEETKEHEYHASLNKDVREEKIIYSSHLLESRKSKHEIDRGEETTGNKRANCRTGVIDISYTLIEEKTSNDEVVESGVSIFIEDLDIEICMENKILIDGEPDETIEFKYDELEELEVQILSNPLNEWDVGTIKVSRKFKDYQMQLMSSIKENKRKLTWNDTFELLALSSIIIMSWPCPYSTFTSSEWRQVLDTNPYKINQSILTDSLLTSLYKATNNFSLGLNHHFILNNDDGELGEKASRVFNYIKDELPISSKQKVTEDKHRIYYLDPFIKPIFGGEYTPYNLELNKSLGGKQRPDFSCVIDDIALLNSEIKPLGCTPLRKNQDFIKVHIKGKKSVNQFLEKGGPNKTIAFLNIADTIESFIIDLAYDGVYRSWPCLKNKLATDKGSFPLMVLTFSHFVMIEQHENANHTTTQIIIESMMDLVSSAVLQDVNEVRDGEIGDASMDCSLSNGAEGKDMFGDGKIAGDRVVNLVRTVVADYRKRRLVAYGPIMKPGGFVDACYERNWVARNLKSNKQFYLCPTTLPRTGKTQKANMNLTSQNEESFDTRLITSSIQNSPNSSSTLNFSRKNSIGSATLSNISPGSHTSNTIKVTNVKNVPSSTPAINIFSNDGSFLDRFKKMKAEEDEKKKQREALERKKAFEDRIKNRGKRRSPPTDDVEPDSKRINLEEDDNEALDPKANAYLKEMQKYNERLCKDDSGHVRPLVK
ncbi:hypothetical protein G9A89_012960 [Geosiphon pyriformis]|nr:hypothetical protein G9A89_012960 [Geosiphon pyriformis]